MERMISSLFHTLVYVPLYNGLIGLLSIGSWVDVGMAVIVLTVLAKLLLLPLSVKASRTQRMLKELEVPAKEIRERYKNDREEQGKKLLELYRTRGVNPFSGFVVLFIQLPIILGLYWVFLEGGLPSIDTSLLYPIIHAPHTVNMWFLGIIDVSGKNLMLAVLTGVTQYVQAHLALPDPGPRSEQATCQEDFARSMQLQMKYMLPIVVGFVSYVASAAVALYWITSNIFAIAQEWYVQRKLEHEKQTV